MVIAFLVLTFGGLLVTSLATVDLPRDLDSVNTWFKFEV